MATSLSQLFVAACGEAARPYADSPALEASLQRQLEAARAALPDVEVVPADFVRHLARGVRAGADPRAALDSLHGADIALTLAAARGERLALAELDRRLSQVVARALAHMRVPEGLVSEVEQQLRQTLLVPTQPGRAPRVLDYLGRGPLAHWLKAGAVRTALNLLERQRPGAYAPQSALEAVPASGPDPELLAVRQRYAPEFKAAFQAAIEGLPADERNYLRMYFVEGLTVEEIGRMRGAHKSTVSRWLARIRQDILADVRRRLQERLKLQPDELDSLVDVLRSQLDLSLHRVLAPEGD
ncbi:MAG: sigma-70 family RNA polymerase sigma factor [Myxococcaceae bacterium]|nr:sigma-70 family RNA polymerase sigma factor [Myxococcaceae bacterium]MCI0669090.1 sigma-70 family RNA polymerase sigma factor [Myxococcaceae bacterium]